MCERGVVKAMLAMAVLLAAPLCAQERDEERGRGPREEGRRKERGFWKDMAEGAEAKVRELKQAIETRTKQVKDMIRAYGEDDERVEKAKREIAELRETLEALMDRARGAFRRGGRRRGEREGRMDEQQAERALNFLREMGQVERAEELSNLRERNPRQFHREIREVMEWSRHMARLREEDPEAFELHQSAAKMEHESHKLAQACRKAQGDEREELRGKLAKRLSELFDMKMRIRQQEVQRVAEELKRMKERFESRRKGKSRIVERRLLQLTGEMEELEW